MEKLVKECNLSILQIENATELLMMNSIDLARESVSAIISNIMILFPEMVTVYSQSPIPERNQEILNWPILLERILLVNGKNDTFLLIDIIYFEVRMKLLSFIDLLNIQLMEEMN